MRSRASASLGGLLLSALALPASGCGCDDVGCADQYVTVDAGTVPIAALPITKTLCVDDACLTTTDEVPLDAGGQTSLPLSVEASIVDIGATPLDDDTPVRISIEVVAADGTVLVDATGTATPDRYKAVDCGPWCVSIGAIYDPTTGNLSG